MKKTDAPNLFKKQMCMPMIIKVENIAHAVPLVYLRFKHYKEYIFKCYALTQMSAFLTNNSSSVQIPYLKKHRHIHEIAGCHTWLEHFNVVQTTDH